MLIPDSLRRSLAYCAVLLLSLPIGYALACLRYPEVPELGAALLHLLNNLLAASGAWVGAATLHQLREAIAEQYGGYRLVRRLGEGAFGEVWEARHKFLERPAAIKLMRPSAHDPTMVERFYREASILSQLESPHTVRLYDYGSTEEGKLYLAMELLRGETLSEVVRTRGPLPEPVVLSILAQACHSLLEAHEKGLVHRDIKPDNLFLCAFGLEKDFLKVLDFGLAKQVTDSVALTRASEVVGTPDFMSPEQIQGQPLDGRSDLYSLGCLGCFLLSGQKPFPGENPARVLAGHLYLEPSWPTASPQLLAVLRRCMEKDREHRFASAAALLGAIQA